MPLWTCGADLCRGIHGEPEHRCGAGGWPCGRIYPPCPGHARRHHRCPSGQVWHCGAIGCVTHRSPRAQCGHLRRICNRMSPPCTGHQPGEAPCAEGAVWRKWPTLNGAPIGREVTRILRLPEVGSIRFELFGSRITGADFGRVADAVADDRLSIMLCPPGLGFYDPVAGTLYLHERPGRRFGLSQDDKALLVHEAVHVIHDMERHTLSEIDEEITAYVAQTMYLTARNVGRFDRDAAITQARNRRDYRSQYRVCMARHADDACMEAITLGSAQIAHALMDGERPPRGAVEELRRALPRADLYHGTTRRRITGDGVARRAWR